MFKINHCIIFGVVIGVSLATLSNINAAEFSIKREKSGDIAIHIDGKLFTRYVTTDKATNKCYFWPIIGPGGAKMTRAYPMQDVKGEKQDHPHHRHLFGPGFQGQGPGPGSLRGNERDPGQSQYSQA